MEPNLPDDPQAPTSDSTPQPSGPPPTVSIAGSNAAELPVQSVVLIAAAAVGVLATFLPWVQVPIRGQINGIDGDGGITLVLCALALVVATRASLSIARRAVIGILGLAVSAIGIHAVFNVYQARASVDDGDEFSQVFAQAITIGAGLYFVIIAGVVLVLGAALLRPPSAKAR